MDEYHGILILVILGYGWANYELKKKVKELEAALEKEKQEENTEN